MTTTPLPYLQLFPAFAGTDNPALTAALQALPNYDAHQAGKQRIAEAVQQANAEVLKAAQARVALVQQVTATARADKPQPLDLTRQAVRSAQALADARETVALLREADQTVSVERDQTLSTAPATLMRHLNGQLTDALSQARALGLDDVHTAAEAIEADQVDAWRQLVVLTDIATQIREAQRTISLTLTNAQEQHRDTFGAVRNYAELFPEWYYAQRRIPVGIVNGEPVYPTPPWDEGTATGLWDYAVRHTEVELWVPTDQEIQTAYNQAMTTARQIENAQAREDQGVPLSADERDRLKRHRSLERHYLTPEGVGR